ncbi:protein FAM124A [Aplysia californica]|uniref:Protein FAM124A n=1 Tax=Aplysia californica TaxID=6500 RepID=A0ABM0K3Q6_APLCA|nr:protein FAM124A [Aplysia californica]
MAEGRTTLHRPPERPREGCAYRHGNDICLHVGSTRIVNSACCKSKEDFQIHRCKTTGHSPIQRSRDHVTDQRSGGGRLGVCLHIVAPSGRQGDMCRILRPLCKRVAGLGDVLMVVEPPESLHPSSTHEPPAPKYTVVGGEISSPSLAVMIFLPEFGRQSHEELHRKLQKPPWRHHHTIQLQRAQSSCVVGKQEFYFLSRQLPMWSVCPSVHDTCKIRINIFVRRYAPMVEFYRLVTGTEMESSKQGFCLFPLNLEHSSPADSRGATTTSTSYELALKHCPHVNPYSLTNAYLTFPTHNMTALRAVLHTDVTSLNRHHYVVHDPDGNAIILHDVTASRDSASSRTLYLNHPSSPAYTEPVDKASVHSGSIDSGRFSDFDACSAELDHYMSKLIKTCKLAGEDDEDSAFTASMEDQGGTCRPWHPQPPRKQWDQEKGKNHFHLDRTPKHLNS